MTTKKLTKLLALYLPYILLGLVATNFGEAWRLAEGKELGDKIMSMMGTVPPVSYTHLFPGRRSRSARRTASSGRTAFRLERRITSASRRSAAFIDSPSLQRCPPLRDSAPETAE